MKRKDDQQKYKISLSKSKYDNHHSMCKVLEYRANR